MREDVKATFKVTFQLHSLGLIKVMNTFGQSLWSATFSAKSSTPAVFCMHMKQRLRVSLQAVPTLSILIISLGFYMSPGMF